MPQQRQADARDLALVHDREQLVLQVGPAARELVEEHELRLPDRPGRGDEPQPRGALVGHRDPDEVVVVDQRRVVVAELEPQRRRDPLGHERLRGAVRAHEQQRRLCRERRQQHGVEPLPPHHAERRGQRQPSRPGLAPAPFPRRDRHLPLLSFRRGSTVARFTRAPRRAVSRLLRIGATSASCEANHLGG